MYNIGTLERKYNLTKQLKISRLLLLTEKWLGKTEKTETSAEPPKTLISHSFYVTQV